MCKYSAVLAVMFLVFVSGCKTSRWEINHLETTFLNEESNREYIQKNAILLNKHTGETWVFTSDPDSNYSWVKLQTDQDASN